MKAILTILILCLAVTAGHAQQHGPLTYTVAGDQISIIDCDQSASGEIVIPDEIDGVPVSVTPAGFHHLVELFVITDESEFAAGALLGRLAFIADLEAQPFSRARFAVHP